MDLLNKRLLLLGGSAFAKDIHDYAIKKGIYLVAVGNSESASYKKIADESYMIDFKNYYEVCKLIKEKKIDGFFGGASEVSINAAIELSELSGIRFYTNKNQWEQLSNKKMFKDNLKKFDIGTIPEYNIDDFISKEEYTKSLYPVLIKPVDGSGAKGISVCRNYDQLVAGYRKALNNSKIKKVILEKYLENMDDVFIRYHIQDYKYSISSSFDKYSTKDDNINLRFPFAYLHPSKHLKEYIEQIDFKMQSLFKYLDIQNGVMTLQAFVDEKRNFYFYEAGYRLGGSQSYIFTDAINNSNSLHYMINLALTGKMSDENISLKDKPFFNQSCCNLYFPLRAGKIHNILGLEKIKMMSEVLNVTQFNYVGDYINNTNSLEQICFRMHLMAKDSQELSEAIKKVNSELLVLNENGDNLIIEYFNDFDKNSQKQ